jgi:MFS family permease
VVARSITCQPGGSSGVGVANLYPLSLALTLAAAPRNGDRAQAATQLLGGGLVIAAPYLLGSLADHLGLHAAFAIDLVLIGACAALLLAGLRSGDVEQRGERPQHV